MWANFCLLRVSDSLPLDFYVDAWYPVHINGSIEEMQVLAHFYGDQFTEAQRNISMMQLRSRYNHFLGNGVLLFKTEENCTADEIEAVLKSLSEEKLQQYIEEARI